MDAPKIVFVLIEFGFPQHHDMIVTSNDVGLEVKCNYNLANKTISHMADLAVDGDLYGTNAEQTIVQGMN